MGLYDETKKFEEMENSINARFLTTDAGVKVSVDVDASQQEVEALIKSLIEMLAEGNKVHVATVLTEITLSMMADDLGGEE